VFFADVAGYTSIAEQLDPEESHQIMDGCFKILMDEIHKYEGTINQFNCVRNIAIGHSCRYLPIIAASFLILP
jgi:hypothetical protein